MSLATRGLLFWFWFGLALSLIPFLICLLIMHFLMPQAVLDRYWKEPYFRPFELMLFSGWSFFAPMRTMMFMWTFMFPRLGKRRGIIEPHRLVPRWYRIVSIGLCVWVAAIVIGSLCLGVGFYIYFLVLDKSKVGWGMHIALVILIACFAFVGIRHWWLNRREATAKRKRSGRKREKSA